ncbi:MAG: hypothetical protein ACLRWP_08335 [Bilophila wadsworthia]
MSLHVLSQPLPERRAPELALFVRQSHLAERPTTLLKPSKPAPVRPPGCGNPRWPSCSHAPGR